MLIDKNGRVLGKINIIDLLAILLIVALFSVLGTKFLLPQTGEETMQLQFFTGEAENWVAEKIQPSASLYDKENGAQLGLVTGVETGTPHTWATTAEGQYVPASRDGFCSLTIRGSAMGKKDENGVEIDGIHYAVGQTVLLCAGDVQLSVRVRDIRTETAGSTGQTGKK